MSKDKTKSVRLLLRLSIYADSYLILHYKYLHRYMSKRKNIIHYELLLVMYALSLNHFYNLTHFLKCVYIQQKATQILMNVGN